ncbi:Murein L,D-transpeptidase YcbB/YkuD [Halopseudomonas litoralis]|uniref:Murein L,D-transpeptidase YcbB/YkuD n=1 Tax=Halopseudomonas litoralis TaxID=797277 RepID=A0A1H1RF73_9GAMM|nr:L,D-transpeptidase family protein [Halopseudomonas litoralis]SDS34404.1 Murein L,D-transpeptidase YcbB/YkuD [Halopseudomonas litoralis]
MQGTAEQCNDLAQLRSMPIAEALEQLYQANGYISIWKQEERLQSLQEELQELAGDGLAPGEYAHAFAEQPEEVCDELRLSGDYLLALEHLSRGRLNPEDHEPMWRPEDYQPPSRLSVADLAAQGLADMTRAFDVARPSLPQYVELRRAYRQMDREPVVFAAFPEGPSIKAGQSDPRLPQLAQRLMLEGFLPSEPVTAGPLTEPVAPFTDPVRAQPLQYNARLQQAVRAFQVANGLQSDGIVGRQTVAALNITPEERLLQVRINLERLRWLDASRGEHVLLVNSAGSNAVLFRGNEVQWHSRVQSGTPDRATPLMISRINRVTLNPSWTIPPTILQQDKLPAIRANPSYFAERDLQALDFEGNRLNPADIDWSNPQGVMLRQPPGPNNPLGKMVFRFDNPFAVFLHDTPSQSLFERATRNVSSGCVRVEQATDLADYLFHSLDNQQRERITRLQANGKTREVNIDNGPQVILGYWTVQVMENGELRYLPDPYDMDEALWKAFSAAVRL